MIQMTDLRRPRRAIDVTPIVQRKRHQDQRQELEDLRWICRKQRLVIAASMIVAFMSLAGMLLMAMH